MTVGIRNSIEKRHVWRMRELDSRWILLPHVQYAGGMEQICNSLMDSVLPSVE